MTTECSTPAAAGSAFPGAASADGNGVPGQLRKLLRRWVPLGDLEAYLQPGGQPLLLELRRAALIVSRARVVAALAAASTFAWIAVDLLLLPLGTAAVLAIARLLAAAAFAWLAVSFARRDTLRDACASLAILYAIATAFFVFSLDAIVASKAAVAHAQPLIALYAFIPVMAVMGLALFPLTLAEVLVLAGLVWLGHAAAGWLGLWHAAPGYWFAGSWQLLLAAAIAGVACANQLALMRGLMQQAMHDALTGCFSRASMETLLEMHFASAERRGTPLAVAFLDIDDFKSVNDRHGHDAGDRVLAEFAARLRAASRRGDMVGRWGGEEFIVLLPHAGIDQAAVACERMNGAGLGTRPDGRPVTASIGLAERDRDGTASWQGLVEQADARMFQAKRLGKNRVVAC